MNLDIGRVNLLEKDIEDYLWRNPQDVIVYTGADGTEIGVAAWIGRQVEVPSGIIDLFGVLDNGFPVVVEVKNGPLDGRAVAQVLRYKYDIKEILEMRYRQWMGSSVCAVIIGSSIETKTMRECKALDVLPLVFHAELNIVVSQRVFTDDHEQRYADKLANLAYADNIFTTFDGKFGAQQEVATTDVLEQVEALVGGDEE